VTFELVNSEAMERLWKSVKPPPAPEDVVKLALGPGKVEALDLKLSFSPWEAILAEMITGDPLGAAAELRDEAMAWLENEREQIVDAAVERRKRNEVENEKEGES
jgi:hypothetical protein